MPHLIVTASRASADGEAPMTMRERINVADFESEHFVAQLIERLAWAVEDADAAEHAGPPDADR